MGASRLEFQGIKLIDIDSLGLSQIYLSALKIASITEWFNPQCMDNFEPIQVHDFGDNTYTITDGHTRTYVAYKNGVSALPAVYDNDDMVAGQVGQMLYKADIEWCKRFKLSRIQCLEDRILSKTEYQRLWIRRCDRSYDLLTQTSYGERMKLQNLAPSLYLYGAAEDLSEMFFESETGELFVCRNGILLPEA